MKKSLILILLVGLSVSPPSADGGILNSSYEVVAAMLGKPSSHDHGDLSGIGYERYHFETNGWKTAVLFIDGRAQKFDTLKSDGSAISADEKKAILDGYDVPNAGQNEKVRGWRQLGENHFIRGDGRVHVIMSQASVTGFLDDLPREFW